MSRHDLFQPSLIKRLQEENVALVMSTRIIGLIQALTLEAKFYAGKQKEFFSMVGYLFNKKLSKTLFRDVNRM